MQSELSALLGELRVLSNAYRAGDNKSPGAFRELATKLLLLTVADASSFLQLVGSSDTPGQHVLTGANQSPVRLNDGRYLRMSIGLYRESTDKGMRLKVRESSFQYQADLDGKQWIFRYDYIRDPPEHVPSAHVQFRGELTESLPPGITLDRIHFPTMRVSLEAVIRLLAIDFGVSCNEKEELWRPALETTENAFHEIHHVPFTATRQTPQSTRKK